MILFATVCLPSVALSAFIQVIDEETNLIRRTTNCLLENPNKKSVSPALLLMKKFILHLKTASCQTWYMFFQEKFGFVEATCSDRNEKKKSQKSFHWKIPHKL